MKLIRLHEKAEQYAHDRGGRDGENAAEWYVQDAFGGRVTSPAAALHSARRIIVGIGDGDPEVMDALPAPDLSGEWADGTSSRDLIADSISATGVDNLKHARLWLAMEQDGEDFCIAYEEGFTDAVGEAVEKAAREHVAHALGIGRPLTEADRKLVRDITGGAS
jgi:hypothetical protein